MTSNKRHQRLVKGISIVLVIAMGLTFVASIVILIAAGI